jgi:phosphatidate phosphatase LPIN
MQYVRNLSDSVSTAWNSINPATLSGAIDVIVVEQEDGSLACSPFHVRFGKFSLLRPFEKKVEFKVNGVKQPYAMKLGEGGEAFFVFETSDTIPKSLQTSPLVSPASSPPLDPMQPGQPPLQEPESLDLNDAVAKARPLSISRPPPTVLHPIGRDGMQGPLPQEPGTPANRHQGCSRRDPRRQSFPEVLQLLPTAHPSVLIARISCGEQDGSSPATTDRSKATAHRTRNGPTALRRSRQPRLCRELSICPRNCPPSTSRAMLPKQGT